MNRNRPGIYQLGTASQTPDGGWLLKGWGLTRCMSHCLCHSNPTTKDLQLRQDDTRGRLGLVSYKAGCTCCQPWTGQELADFLANLVDIVTLTQTAGGQQ